MQDLSTEKRQDALEQALRRFLRTGRGEANIMLAPMAELPALADADGPRADVQLFTLTLRPDSGTLLVDVAAYKGSSGN